MQQSFQKKIATLHELRTVYDMEDFLNFLEIIQVNRLNEIKQMEKNEGKKMTLETLVYELTA